MFQPARGTHDLYGTDCQKHLSIVKTARDIVRRYGYEEIITPLFEFTEVFHRLGETSDVVSKETYTFLDRGGDSLTLRPEGTAGVVRAVISNGLTQNLPLRLFYAGSMFRYERPQKGRYRQFDQLGVELCAPSSPLGDVEIITLGYHLLKELGLESKVNLEINSLGGSESRAAYREALIQFFTAHLSSLSVESQARLQRNPLRILDSKDPQDRALITDAPPFKDFITLEDQRCFETVLRELDKLSLRYTLNPLIVRGLDYYCQTTFEFVSEELGAQSAVLAGGRYDGLFKKMGGPDLGGVGWAAGLQRLCLLTDPPLPSSPIIALIPLDEATESELSAFAFILRQQGWIVDFSFTGMAAKRLKRAHKIQARVALLWGTMEQADHSIIVKDLKTGYQEKISRTDLNTTLNRMFTS